MVIKSVNPLSYAKISGLLGAVMGLILGAFMSLFSVFGAFGGRGGGMFAMLWGIGSIVFMPIFYAVCGFIFSFIGAIIYNFAAGIVGGIEVEVQ
jgi:hypothetical protein